MAGEEFVVRGAKMVCDKCEECTGNKFYVRLDIPQDHGVSIQGQPIAAAKDCVAGDNIKPFGTCTSKKYSLEKIQQNGEAFHTIGEDFTGASESAGTQLCIFHPEGVWQNTNNIFRVASMEELAILKKEEKLHTFPSLKIIQEGETSPEVGDEYCALTMASTLTCRCGGTIKFISSGQEYAQENSVKSNPSAQEVSKNQPTHNSNAAKTIMGPVQPKFSVVPDLVRAGVGIFRPEGKKTPITTSDFQVFVGSQMIQVEEYKGKHYPMNEVELMELLIALGLYDVHKKNNTEYSKYRLKSLEEIFKISGVRSRYSGNIEIYRVVGNKNSLKLQDAFSKGLFPFTYYAENQVFENSNIQIMPYGAVECGIKGTITYEGTKKNEVIEFVKRESENIFNQINIKMGHKTLSVAPNGLSYAGINLDFTKASIAVNRVISLPKSKEGKGILTVGANLEYVYLRITGNYNGTLKDIDEDGEGNVEFQSYIERRFVRHHRKLQPQEQEIWERLPQSMRIWTETLGDTAWDNFVTLLQEKKENFNYNTAQLKNEISWGLYYMFSGFNATNVFSPVIMTICGMLTVVLVIVGLVVLFA